VNILLNPDGEVLSAAIFEAYRGWRTCATGLYPDEGYQCGFQKGPTKRLTFD
jgi:hypothetical protein